MTTALYLRSCPKHIVLAATAVSIGSCMGMSSSSRSTAPANAVMPRSAPSGLEQEYVHQIDDEVDDYLALGAGGAAHGHGMAFPSPAPTVVHPSLISFAINMGAKRVSKGTLKNFIKSRIKAPLGKLKDKKLARELADEADQILGMLDDPWWSTAIGFVPIMGDALDLTRVPSQTRKALGRARAVEHKVQAALHAEHKARQAAPAASSAARYVSAPRSIKAFPDLVPAKFKTPVQGGSRLRRRWTDKDGNIYEWDYQHGRLEKYDRRGRHLGELDPNSGKMIKGPDSTRSVEP